MNNDRIDLSRESLNNEGNIWLNRKTKQLRTSLGKNEPNSWYNPISSYEVGSENKLRRGQPVSVGYLDQLYSESKLSGDSCIVPTNPSINQWCIGLALEPGFHRDGNSVKKIHVQSNGQIEYDLSTKDDDDYYLPPHSDTKFEWNYDDIGKPVFVSNKNPGELTLDIAEAAYNGGTIVCVGRIADAPLADEKNISLQKIILEVQLSGDVRGVVDTSQIQVEIANRSKHADLGIQIENIESDFDRVFFFFIKDGLAYFILDDETVNKYSQNSPVGALVVNSKNGVLDIESLLGTKTLVFRLGLLKGNFGFSKVGNTAYLSNGFIDESAASSSYDYKVGVILSKDSILIDCRYPRFVAKKTMIGDIKPLFENGLCEPGYAKVDNEVHKVIFDKNDPVCADGIDWKYLVGGTYTKDLFVFSRSKDGPFTTILEGGWTPDGANEDSTGFLNKYTYFKFRDLVYTIGDNTCGCQIKFSKDDAPEAMNYIWPEQTFELSLVPDPGREDDENYVLGGNLSSSKLKLDISKLTALGQYMDSNGQNIEAYDIIVREKISNQLISSGFYQVESDGQMKWCGYEWKVSRDSYTNQTFLTMITVPGEEPNSRCLGFCWPIGQKLTSKVDLYVTVRRRPTQYHDLYLNQVNQNNPWAPYTDGNNLITGDSIFFGAKLKETPADSGVGQNSGYNKENIGTGEIHFSSSNNEGSINTIITEPDSNENKIKVFYDIKSVATRANNDKIRRYIKWGYNFEDNITTLSSAFAPSLVQPSTKEDYLYSSEDCDLTALEVLHEFIPKIISYKDDDDETKNNWKKLSYRFDDIVDAINNEKNYKIYDIDEIQGLEYSTIKNSDNLIKSLSLLYGSSNGYMSYISNFGFLNLAAKETQDRLLKIERALFGADFYSNPNGRLSKNENFVEIEDCISNSGLLREVNALKDLDLIHEGDGDSIKQMSSKNGFSSSIRDLFISNHGNYTDQDEFDALRSDFDIKDYIEDDSIRRVNHLMELWLDYCLNKKTNIQLSINSSFITGDNDYYSQYMLDGESCPTIRYDPSSFVIEKNSVSANKIYLLHSAQLYNGEKFNFNKDDLSYEQKQINGRPLPWPLTKDSYFKQIDTYTNFHNAFYCGLTDRAADGSSTFGSNSLEGLVLDIYSKLSYLKNYIRFDETIKGDKALFTSNINLYEKGKALCFTYEKFSTIEDTNIYDAFIFKDGKLYKGLNTSIEETGVELYFGTEFNSYSTRTAPDSDYNSFIRKWQNVSKIVAVGDARVNILTDYYKFFALWALSYIGSYILTVDSFKNDWYLTRDYNQILSHISSAVGEPYTINAFVFGENADNYIPQFYTLEDFTIISQQELIKHIVEDSALLESNESLGMFVDNTKIYRFLNSNANFAYICNTLLKPYYSSYESMRASSSYNKTIYDITYPISGDIPSAIYSLYNGNFLKKIFVDYENTIDGDQRSLTDESNNINEYLKFDIPENLLIDYSKIDKVDDDSDDIILDKSSFKTIDFVEDADETTCAVIDCSENIPETYSEEKFVKVGGQNLPKEGSLNVSISSLKDEFSTYNNYIEGILKSDLQASITVDEEKINTDGHTITVEKEVTIPKSSTSVTIGEENYDIDIPERTFTLSFDLDISPLVEKVASSVFTALKKATLKLDQSIIDEDIVDSINDLTLSASETASSGSLQIERSHTDYDLKYVKEFDIEKVDDAFNNRCINKVSKSIQSEDYEDDATYKDFTISDYDSFEDIKTRIDSSINYSGLFAELSPFIPSENVDVNDLLSTDTALTNFIKGDIPEVIVNASMLESLISSIDSNILHSKFKFIQNFIDDSYLYRITTEVYSRFMVIFNEIYNSLKSQYDEKLKESRDEKVLRIAPKLSDNYILHGKQLKKPVIALAMKKELFAGLYKNRYSSSGYNQLLENFNNDNLKHPAESDVYSFELHDIYNRRIKFTFTENGFSKDYTITKLVIGYVKDLPKDQNLNLITHKDIQQTDTTGHAVEKTVYGDVGSINGNYFIVCELYSPTADKGYLFSTIGSGIALHTSRMDKCCLFDIEGHSGSANINGINIISNTTEIRDYDYDNIINTFLLKAMIGYSGLRETAVDQNEVVIDSLSDRTPQISVRALSGITLDDSRISNLRVVNS